MQHKSITKMPYKPNKLKGIKKYPQNDPRVLCSSNAARIWRLLFIEAISNGSHIKTFNLQKIFNLRKSSTNKKYLTYEKHQTYKNHLGYQKHGKCSTYKEHSTNEKY